MRSTAIIVFDHDSGTSTVYSTIRKVIHKYGISPNKLYRLLYTGEVVKLRDTDGNSLNISFRYKNDKIKIIQKLVDEGDIRRSRRYKPVRSGDGDN